MGVSIHYRGKLADIRKIDVLCDELASIADKMGWICTRLNKKWSKALDATIEADEYGAHTMGHLPLKGISLNIHPQCESLRFFFDPTGYLCDPVSMAMISIGNFKSEDAWISVKTQFAGPGTHIWIVDLLRYLKAHYITDLEVHDEGEYWETGDREILEKKMDLIAEKTATVSDELSKVTRGHIASFSADELASVIESLLCNKFRVEDSKKDKEN